jgi:hypothetical protein
MSWRRLLSRCGEPTAPRKYLLVTMFVAFTDQKSGNSTPRCSKFTLPSRQFVMTTSRRSQVTSSYGWTPGVVWILSTVSPRFALGLRPRPDAAVPTVSVMLSLSCDRAGAPDRGR